MSLNEYTKAKFLCDFEKKTKVTVRFSKVFGSEGESDTARDIIGMFTKFETEDGNFDVLCHNIWDENVFMDVENIMIFLDMAKKRNSLVSDKEIWETISMRPEFMPLILKYFSDRCTVKSYRNIEAYGMNDYIFKNKNSEERNVKFKLSPVGGVKYISRQEAEFFAGFDKDVAIRELQEAIERNKYPEYYVELILENSDNIVCGKITLENITDPNVAESIAFTPANVVEGISLAANNLNRLTSFAFNESARKRGGRR